MYSRYTFRQGIHPDYHKEPTSDKSLRQAKRPDKVIIPVQQHIGAPCSPIVEVGEHVKLGQKVADSDSFVSAPIHASVSGVVKGIEKVLTPSGQKVDSIIIEADDIDEPVESFARGRQLTELSPAEIREIIREAGIVGLGGAMFPTHVKLSVPEGKEVYYLILNGAECEPYLTVDYRIMIEKAQEVVLGLKILMKASGASKGIIAIEDNKPEAIKAMNSATAAEMEIDIKILNTKYPQGGEKMMIAALLEREVPAGGLPLDVGVVVNNVSTAVAVHDAVLRGIPLVERAITITGSGIKEPCNIVYRIGTPLSELIAEAGGMLDKAAKVITGGPMMGMSQPMLDIPSLKGTSGLLIQTEDEIEKFSPQPCIKCARCVDVCPVFLLPLQLASFSKLNDLNQLDEYDLMNCIECGSCSYICPAKRPLLEYIRVGKSQLQAEQMSQKGVK